MMPFSLPAPLPQPQVSSLTPVTGDDGSLAVGCTTAHSLTITAASSPSLTVGCDDRTSLTITLS